MSGEKAGDDGEVDNGEDVQTEIGQQEAPVETRAAFGVRTPFRPSPAEVAEHNLTHLNYRDWCPYCVQGRGFSEPHRKGVDRSDGSEAAVGADYYFVCRDPQFEKEIKDDDDVEGTPEDEIIGTGREKATILTIEDFETGCVRPHLVPRKGIAGVEWIGKAVAFDLTKKCHCSGL